MKKHRLKTRPHCPTCKQLLDGFTAPRAHPTVKPKPGDLSICLRCRTVLEFTPAMMLTRASDDTIEKVGLLALSRAQNQVNEMRRETLSAALHDLLNSQGNKSQ